MNVTINESNRLLDSAITGYQKIARDNFVIYIVRTHKNYTITHCSLLGQNRSNWYLTLLYVKVESKLIYWPTYTEIEVWSCF
jgi:hypothetical protein